MSGSQTIIRKANVADVPVILALIRELADYERLLHEVVATEASLEQSLFTEGACSEVLLAIQDDRVVGFALYFANYSTFLAREGIYLEDIYVRPQARGQGIGKRLLAEVANVAVERNAGRLEWAVLDWNEAAIGFYRSLGAVTHPEWVRCRVTGEALQRLADSRN